MNSLNILLFGIVIFAFYMLGSIMTLVICIAHYEKRSYTSAAHKIWKIFSSIIKDEAPEEIFPLLIGYDPVMKIFDFAQIDAFFAPVSQIFATFYCNSARFWKNWEGVSYRFAVTPNPNSSPLAQLEDMVEQLTVVEIGKYLASIGRTDLKPQLLVAAELRQNGELVIRVALTNTGAGKISQFKQQRQQRRAKAAQKKNMTTNWPGGGTP